MKALGKVRGDERGISTVIVAVSLVGLFGAVMLSLDYGNTVQIRRNLVTGTDATALEQAGVEVKRAIPFTGAGPIDCPEPESTWANYLARNVGTYELAGIAHPCAIYPNGSTGTGYVVIQSRKVADTRIGGLFGIGDTHPFSLSAAQYGFTTGARGLRPMGFCNGNDHVQEWLSIVDLESDGTTITPAEQAWFNSLPTVEPADHPNYAGAGVVHRMWFSQQPDDGACGGSPGNWGWMDFECTRENRSSCGNPNPDIRDWLDDGYQGIVNVWKTPNDAPPVNSLGNSNGTCDILDEVDPSLGCVNGTDGMRLVSEQIQMNLLVANGTHFHVPIFKNVQGTGNNSKYEIYGFLGVRLWDWDKVGSDGYMDMEFFELLLDGICCSPTPEPGSQPGVKICEVDHDGDTSDAVIAARCGQAP